MKRNLDAIVLRYVGYALVFLGGAYLLYLVRAALPIFFVAALLAYALEPILQLLERRGYSRSGAVGFVFLIFLLLFALLITLLIAAWQQAQELQGNPKPFLDSLTHWQENLRAMILRMRLPNAIKTGALSTVADLSTRLTTWGQGFAVAMMQNIVGSLGALMVNLIILPIITLNFMLEMNAIRGRALMLVPAEHRRDVVEIAASINGLLGRYVRGQMIVCGLFGLLCTISFWVLGLTLGMQYGLILGVLAGVIYIVPYVGVLTVVSAAGLTAYLTSSQPGLCAALAVGSCIVFNLAIDYVIAPRVLGKGIGLHPLLVIFALLAGAAMGGPLYMILAVPVVASLRVLLIYLFPQMTTPLPQTPPENEKSNRGESHEEHVTEVVQQVNSAEAKTSESPA